MRRNQSRQRLEPELEPVRLVLVAAEKQHGAAARRMLGRSEVLDIDRVVQHLPGPGGLAHALVRGSLAELALVEDVISLPQNPVQRSVEGLGARSCPAGVSDTVLVDDQRDPPPARVPEERPQVARQPGRSEIQQREVGRMIREPRCQALELRRSSGDGFAGCGHTVVSVEHAYTCVGSRAREQPRPARPGSGVPGDARPVRHVARRILRGAPPTRDRGVRTRIARRSCVRAHGTTHASRSRCGGAEPRSRSRSTPSTSTRRPVSPSRTMLGACPTRVETSGTPAASASSTPFGPPS